MGITLLTGGARSGKSALAVSIASARGGPVTFVATAEPRDEEMASRIARHRAGRPDGWVTVEEPVDLAGVVAASSPDACVVVDCLTLWISNLLERGGGRAEIEDRSLRTVRAAARREAPVIVVTNEVGSGIVPMHPDTRAYRDLLGTVNSAFARNAEHVILVVAGRAVPLSSFGEVTFDVLGR